MSFRLFGIAIAALLGFWRSHLLSLLMLLFGLATATALWTGVEALNAEARKSYSQAAGSLDQQKFDRIVSTNGQMIYHDEFISMRRGGWRVSPIIEGELALAGVSFQLIGVEPLTLPKDQMGAFFNTAIKPADLKSFMTPPYDILASKDAVKAIGALKSRPGALPASLQEANFQVSDNLPPHTMITDIGLAQKLLVLEGGFSYLLLDERQKKPIAELASLLGDDFQIMRASQNDDLSALTASFHNNLTAFAFLSFVVGLFIVNSAIGFAFEKRRSMLRTLRACGLSLRLLAAALLTELLVLAFIAGCAGILLGYTIAQALLPDVAVSMEGLFRANVSATLTLSPLWWFGGLLIAMAGALLATSSSLIKFARMPVLQSAHGFAWREQFNHTKRLQLLLAAFILLVALLIWGFSDTLLAGFILMGAIFLSSALLLPSLIDFVTSWFAARAKSPAAQWFWADSRHQMSGISVALMALLLALAINVSVGTMVKSFRNTFWSWLDQRLVADIYLRVNNPEALDQLYAFAHHHDDIDVLVPSWNVTTQYEGTTVQVFGHSIVGPVKRTIPLLAESPTVWEDLYNEQTALISEQFANRSNLEVGDELTIGAETQPFTFRIGGIYADYGNPLNQIRIAHPRLVKYWPSVKPELFHIFVKDGQVEQVIDDLQNFLKLPPRSIVDQNGLKRFSKNIFNRTFTITLALQTLTLAVAGIALLTNLLALSKLRLPQLAPLWALGMTRKKLAQMELVKILMLTALTFALALPIGLLEGWILLDMINLRSFGWRLPIGFFPLDWLALGVTCLITVGIAAAYPALRLARAAPSQFLQVFANER